MANSEISVNDKPADVFRAINTDWRLYDHVSSENTEGLSKKKALRPSKLGRCQDIEHSSLDLLEGDQHWEYGIVERILRRPIK